MARAVELTVSARQRAILERWTRNQAGTAYRLVERSRLILMSADGVSNAEQGRRLNIDRQRPRRWRTRWAENQSRLAAAEQKGASDKDLTQLLSSLLADHKRPGKTERIAVRVSPSRHPPSHRQLRGRNR